MKKLSFTIGLVLFGFTCFAQMNTGSWFAAANSSFNFGFDVHHDLDTDVKTTILTYNLNPKVGYFIKNRLGVGGSAEFSSVPGDGIDRLSTLIIGPFARYYVQYGSLIPFGEGAIGFGTGNEVYTFDVTTENYRHTIFSGSIGAGTDLFLNEKIAIETMLKYYYMRKKPTSSNPFGGDGHVNSGIVVYFGIVIFFESI